MKKKGVRYSLVDTLDNSDFERICEGTNNLKLITGGSGIALGLPKIFKKQGLLLEENITLPKIKSYSLIMSGSCSIATLEQVSIYKNKNPSLFIFPEKIINKPDYLKEVTDWTIKNKKKNPMLYTSSKPEEVKKNQKKFGQEFIAEKIEKFFQTLVSKLYRENFKKIVAAGGETSGAVVKGLGIKELQIGEEISAGVPTMWDPNRSIKIALKSGNFGQKDFFSRALKLL